jgi:hypothetical protein
MTDYHKAREMWAPMSIADRIKMLTELQSDPDHAEPGDHDWKTWPPESLAPHDWAALPPQIHALVVGHMPVDEPTNAGAEATTEETGHKTSKRSRQERE